MECLSLNSGIGLLAARRTYLATCFPVSCESLIDTSPEEVAIS